MSIPSNTPENAPKGKQTRTGETPAGRVLLHAAYIFCDSFFVAAVRTLLLCDPQFVFVDEPLSVYS